MVGLRGVALVVLLLLAGCADAPLTSSNTSGATVPSGTASSTPGADPAAVTSTFRPQPPAEPPLQTVTIGTERTRLQLDNPVSPRLFEFRLVTPGPWTMSMGLASADGAVSEGSDIGYGTMVIPEEDLGEPTSCAVASRATLFHPGLPTTSIPTKMGERAGTYRVLVWNAVFEGHFLLLINWGEGEEARQNVTTRLSPWQATETLYEAADTPGPIELALDDRPGIAFASGRLARSDLAEGSWSEELEVGNAQGTCAADVDDGTQVLSPLDSDRPRLLQGTAAGTGLHASIRGNAPASAAPPPAGNSPYLSLHAVLVIYEPRGV